MTDAFKAPVFDDGAAGDRAMTEFNWDALQGLLSAINDMPDVARQIDAYMRGRGHDNPHEEIVALNIVAF